MKNNEFLPILAHDYKSPACITPELLIKYKKVRKKSINKRLSFPKFCIITSQNNIVNNFRNKFNAKLYPNWISNRSKLYVFKIKS